MVPVFEPEGKQSERVLEGIARRECDRLEEGPDSWDDVARENLRRHWLLRALLLRALGVVRDNFGVGKRPRVPRLVPSPVEVGGEEVGSEDVVDVFLEERR